MINLNYNYFASVFSAAIITLTLPLVVAAAGNKNLLKRKLNHTEPEPIASPTYWPTYWPTYSPTDEEMKVERNFLDFEYPTASMSYSYDYAQLGGKSGKGGKARSSCSVGRRGSCERVYGSFTGSQNVLPNNERLARFVENRGTCSSPTPNVFPGNFPCGGGTETCQYLEFEPYCEDGFPEGCLTIDFDTGTCGINVHVMAYSAPFDASDLSLGYLGDVGASVSQTFAMPYVSGSPVYVVAQTNFGPATCDFSFAFGWSKCPSITGFFNTTNTTAIEDEDLPEGSYDKQ